MKITNLLAVNKVFVFFVLGAFISCLWAGERHLIGGVTPKLRDAALVSELKKGGYVIYFRHGATGQEGEKHVDENNITNCEIQRNLSEYGILQTKNIGKAIKKYEIPIGDVLSSPYCRCMDTAINIFGGAKRSNALFFALNTPKEERAVITEQLKVLLSQPPKVGTNTALVSHSANLREATEIWPKPEGVAHVFKPLGEEGFSYIGVIHPNKWRDVSVEGVE